MDVYRPQFAQRLRGISTLFAAIKHLNQTFSKIPNDVVGQLSVQSTQYQIITGIMGDIVTVIIMIAVTLLVVGIFSFLFVRFYEDRRDASCITTSTMALALGISLMALMLIPVDIFTVSGKLDEDGVAQNPDLVLLSGNVIQYLYYAIYCLLVLFAFALLPFAYFYFEEEDETSTPASQARGACRYTIVFLLVWLVLLVVALVTQSRIDGSADADWIQNVQSQMTAWDNVQSFSFGFLAVLGLLGWLTYTPYGLSSLPRDVFQNFETVLDLQHPTPEQASKRRLRLRTMEEEMNIIKARYEYTERSWTITDRARFAKLEKETALLKRREEAQPGLDPNYAQNSASLDCCARCWNLISPFRKVFAFFLFCVSVLIWISILLSVIDRLLHSDCGYKCSYTLTKSGLPNPIDLGLVYASQVFPLDFFLFGLLIIYLFLASVNGLTKIGVRMCCLKLYDVEKYATMSNALTMGIWLMCMLLAAINLQVYVLSPQYSLFGTQFYYDWQQADDSTGGQGEAMVAYTSEESVMSLQNATCGPSIPGCVRVGSAQPCIVSQTNKEENYCVPTVVGSFLLNINTRIPLFGAVIFYTNILFLLSCLVSFLLVCCRDKRARGDPLKKPLWGPDTDLGERSDR
eukprot:g49850.t1